MPCKMDINPISKLSACLTCFLGQWKREDVQKERERKAEEGEVRLTWWGKYKTQSTEAEH